MHHAVVVDASVLVKLYVAEEFSDQALALISDSVTSGRSIIGPAHVLSEVTNAIRKQEHQGNLTASEAYRAVQQLMRLSISLVSVPEVYQEGLIFAREHGFRYAYDSMYAVLAKMMDAEFWTDDRVFLRDVADSAPWVRWIGNYPIE